MNPIDSHVNAQTAKCVWTVYHDNGADLGTIENT